MDLFLNDNQIDDLIAEEKQIKLFLKDIWALKTKGVHKENDFTINRLDGSQFKIILRQNTLNVLDFSVIIGYIPKESNQVFKLKRYNGKSHQHSNKIEKQIFYDFHIHKATERYQTYGMKEESFGEPSNRYSDIKSAFACLINDCNIIFANEKQLDFGF